MGPYNFCSRPYFSADDSIFSAQDRLYSARTVYFTKTVYFQGPNILQSNHIYRNSRVVCTVNICFRCLNEILFVNSKNTVDDPFSKAPKTSYLPVSPSPVVLVSKFITSSLCLGISWTGGPRGLSFRAI